MKKPERVTCSAHPNCGKRWARDPVLEVECPNCGAAIGHECTVLRPSGHRQNKKFAGLPPWGHDERDLKAAAEGHYGVCPLNRCGKRPIGAGGIADHFAPERDV